MHTYANLLTPSLRDAVDNALRELKRSAEWNGVLLVQGEHMDRAKEALAVYVYESVEV